MSNLWNISLRDVFLLEQEAVNWDRMTELNSNFKKWHRGSKFPATIMFHGTNSKFDSFDQSKFGSGITGIAPTARFGFWFASSSDVAKSYGNIIVPVYLKIKNPRYLNTSDWHQLNEYGNRWDAADYLSETKRMGHDGIVVDYGLGIYSDDGIDGEDEFEESENDEYGDDELPLKQVVVFDPKQIKSIYNNGSFSTQTSNIYE